MKLFFGISAMYTDNNIEWEFVTPEDEAEILKDYDSVIDDLSGNFDEWIEMPITRNNLDKLKALVKEMEANLNETESRAVVETDKKSI